MSSSIANDLFGVLEKQLGKAAALSAMTSYLAEQSKAAPVAEAKPHKPWSEETKAKAAEKRAAKKAAGGAETEPAAAPAADSAEKPKRVMSDELKAKMKAGRERAAAAKAAGASDAEPKPSAAEPKEASDGNDSSSSNSEKKKRGPKPLAEMNAEELAAHALRVAANREKREQEKAKSMPPLPASPPPAAGDHMEFAAFKHNGVEYLRNMRGDILTTDHDWVGRFDLKTKSINKAFPKPDDLE